MSRYAPLRFLISRCAWILIAAHFLLSAVPIWAADEDRIAHLNEQIRTLEVVVNGAKNAGEKARLDEKLQRMRREIAILEERRILETQERALRAERPERTLDLLREKLRELDLTVEDAEARLRVVADRRKQAVAERDTLARTIAAGDRSDAKQADRQAEAQEELFTRSEELRALVLEREAAEAEIDLARHTVELRERLKAADDAVGNPGVRALFEAYTRLRRERKTTDRLSATVAELENSRKIGESSREIAQQKLAKFDEELALLEKQTGFFNRDTRIERLLVEQRNQKATLSERMPFISRQVDAIARAQRAFQNQQELAALEARFELEQFNSIRAGYLSRLRWPAVVLGTLVVLHVLASLLVLPLFLKNEALFMARRLARYLLVLLASGVIAGFMFDDLSMVAATLGVVSAALVISLQDVCTSIFAWFVIMTGEKFRIGDRLEIDQTRGDVLDIQLLRTTLLEVNDWLGSDQPTGRVILVPNNVIFKTKIFNYTHEHPFIWGRLEVSLAYSTPIASALLLFQRVLTDETRENFDAARRAASKIHRRYGVDDAVYEPKIQTQITSDGMTLSLLFVAHYKQFSETRNRINRRIIAELETHKHIQLSVHQIQIVPNTPATAPAATLGDNVTTPPFMAAERARTQTMGG